MFSQAPKAPEKQTINLEIAIIRDQTEIGENLERKSLTPSTFMQCAPMIKTNKKSIFKRTSLQTGSPKFSKLKL